MCFGCGVRVHWGTSSSLVYSNGASQIPIFSLAARRPFYISALLRAKRALELDRRADFWHPTAAAKTDTDEGGRFLNFLYGNLSGGKGCIYSWQRGKAREARVSKRGDLVGFSGGHGGDGGGK